MSQPDDQDKPTEQPAAKAKKGDSMTTTVKVMLSIVVVVGVVAFMRFSARGHTGDYAMVDEVMAAHGPYLNKPMKVHGYVEPGSIVEEVIDQEMVRTFVLEYRGKRIMVRNKGPKPDSFKDRSEVVAEGKIIEENGEPVLLADNLMAKCPSKYQGAPKDKLFDQ